MVIDPSDFHWLIGLLEGEGTFLTGPPSNPGLPIVRVSMTDRDVVQRVARLLDRAVVALRPRRQHHKTPFAATIKGAPAVDLMLAVHDFMGVKRRTQIQRAIRSWHKRRSRRWRSPGPCAASGCVVRASKRGLCKRHYNSWWKAHRYGRKSAVVPPEAKSELLQADHSCDATCDLSWLSGLLEGEGTFVINRYSAEIAYPLIGLQMCDAGIVARVARLMGAPNVWRREAEKDGWSPTYATAVSGHDGASWMRRLRDSMGARRRAAIDAALTAYHPIRLVDPPASCVVPSCSKAHRSRGLCHKHYMMWSRDKANGREARIVPLR